MKQPIFLAIVATIVLGSAPVLAQDQEPQPPLGFFVTSTTHSGNLGGLAGADAECQRLATAVDAGGRTWRAYLSTYGDPTQPAVNARATASETGPGTTLMACSSPVASRICTAISSAIPILSFRTMR